MSYFWNKNHDQYLKDYITNDNLSEEQKEQLFTTKLYPVIYKCAAAIVMTNNRARSLVNGGYDSDDFIMPMITEAISLIRRKKDELNFDGIGGLVNQSMHWTLSRDLIYKGSKVRDIFKTVSDNILFEGNEETGSLSDLMSFQEWESNATGSVRNDKEFLSYLVEYWRNKRPTERKAPIANKLIQKLIDKLNDHVNGKPVEWDFKGGRHSSVAQQFLAPVNHKIMVDYINSGELPQLPQNKTT